MDNITELGNLKFYTKQNKDKTYSIFFESDTEDKHYVFKVLSAKSIKGQLISVTESTKEK